MQVTWGIVVEYYSGKHKLVVIDANDDNIACSAQKCVIEFATVLTDTHEPI